MAAQGKGNAGVEPPGYLLLAEVAELLSVSPKTVSRWAKEGKLPFLKTLGGPPPLPGGPHPGAPQRTPAGANRLS